MKEKTGTRHERLPAADRRERILEIATPIFARKGLEGTTTKELARACGISESALYKHFSSKDSLFEEVLKRTIASFDSDEFLAGLPEEMDLEHAFRVVARRILDVGFETPLVQKLLLAATLAGSPEADRLYVGWRVPFVRFLEERIRRGIDRGEVRAVDPVLTARAFVGLVNDCVLSCNLWDRAGLGETNKERLIENNVPIFYRGLTGTSHRGEP